MMTYEQMKQTIIQCCDDYYNQNESNFSDAEFDSLKDEFAQKYPNDPLLKQIGAPVDNSHWEKANHKIPMSSLNKVQTEAEFLKWTSTIGDTQYCCNDKLDGISIAAEYNNGKLISAITRGDSNVGEEIYRNVVKMKNTKCANKTFTGTLRGEIVLKQKDFDDLNALIAKNGEKPMSNPRNAASGIAKRLDGTNSEYLTVLFYDCTGDFKTEEEKFIYLESLGFQTAFWKVGSVDEMLFIYREFEDSRRKNSSYMIDGLVYRANSMSLQKKLGNLGENPKAMIAFKFGAMTGKTKMIDVEWHIGDQSVVSPVAVFSTVNLGTNISRASLYNLENFTNLMLAEGDEVMVSRQNDVIPAVKCVVSRSGNKPFEYPKTCPVCNEPTVIKGKFLYCFNEDCDANVIGSFNKYVAKLDMKGLAESTLSKLVDAHLVETPADLYRIGVEDVLKLEGFATKSAQKVIDIIQSKKEMTLDTFVGSLNIPQFSSSMAKLLIESGYDTLEKIQKLNKDELVAIRGIEEKKAMAFINGMAKKKDLIEDLLAVGIIIKQKEKKIMSNKGGKFSGMSVVFTGTINRIDPKTNAHYNREVLQEFVVEQGGTTPGCLSKEVTHLVQADPSKLSGKTKKALQYGTAIISEEDFFALLGM